MTPNNTDQPCAASEVGGAIAAAAAPQTNNPTNSQFLAELAKGGRKGQVMWVTAFIGNPDGHSGWGGHSYEGPDREQVVDGYRLQNSYFCVAALKYIDGKVRRTKEHFDGLLALVVDDANIVDLLARPSWVLETSPGKIQVGFFLEEGCEDRQNPVLCTALVTRMAKQGLIGGDLSGNNIARYVRLPMGQNQKPRPSGYWDHELKVWAEEQRYSLEDAAAAIGIDLDEVKRELASPSASVSTGAFTGEQSEKLVAATAEIIAGHNLHDSINTVSASLIASGAHPGAVVNMLRGLMQSTNTPKDARWQARFNDIPRSVQTAHGKYGTRAGSAASNEASARLLSDFVHHPPIAHTSAMKSQLESAPHQEPRKLLRSASELLENLKPAQFVVDGYVERDSLVMIYGKSGCGKSFVVVDLACCVATSNPWHGREVEGGPVIFVAGEGQNGIARRLAAWAKHYEKPLDAAPLFVSRCAVAMGDSAALLPLILEIDEIKQELGKDPVAVIIDTVARNFGPGDENSTQDMSAFIGNLDEWIRQRYGCSVILVHHAGHQDDRARGSSALRAALDQEFQVESKNAEILISCTKMKDGETPPGLTFCLQQHELGQGEDGAPILGAALVMDEILEFASRPKLKEGAIQVLKAFLDAASPDPSNGDVILLSEDDWRTAHYQANPAKKHEALKKSFARAKSLLLAQRYVSEVGGPSAAASFEGRRTEIAQALGRTAAPRDSPGTSTGHVPVPDARFGGTSGTHP